MCPVAYVASFVAQYAGAGKPERIGPAVWQALYVGTLAGLGFLLLLPAAGPIFAWAGHEPKLQELEATYFRYLCFSALPALWNSAACGFFSGRGDSRTVLLVNGTGLVVNVILCLGLVEGRWGLPRLGIAGAGLATVAGSSVSATLSLGLMLRPRYWGFGVWSGRRLDAELLRRLLRFGFPNGLLVGL